MISLNRTKVQPIITIYSLLGLPEDFLPGKVTERNLKILNSRHPDGQFGILDCGQTSRELKTRISEKYRGTGFSSYYKHLTVKAVQKIGNISYEDAQLFEEHIALALGIYCRRFWLETGIILYPIGPYKEEERGCQKTFCYPDNPKGYWPFWMLPEDIKAHKERMKDYRERTGFSL